MCLVENLKPAISISTLNSSHLGDLDRHQKMANRWKEYVLITWKEYVLITWKEFFTFWYTSTWKNQKHAK